MLGLVEKGAFTMTRMVDALTRAPAKIASLPAPTIKEGARADLALVDPNRTWTIEPSRLRTKSQNTPFLGQTVKGMVLATVVAGQVVFEA
jgi:dihydroorotase